MNENAATDIERMLGQMAERAACKQLETERLKELNEAAQSISYGDIHSGVNIQVHRIAQVDDELEDQFYQICGPLLDISKKLQRSLVQKLNDQQRGGKQTGLVMGRRLDAHALCRNDGKVFYTSNLPNEIEQQELPIDDDAVRSLLDNQLRRYFAEQIEGRDELEGLTEQQITEMVTAPNVPQCIRRQLEKNGFLIDSFWESVAKASSDLVRQYKEKLV